MNKYLKSPDKQMIIKTCKWNFHIPVCHKAFTQTVLRQNWVLLFKWHVYVAIQSRHSEFKLACSSWTFHIYIYIYCKVCLRWSSYNFSGMISAIVENCKLLFLQCYIFQYNLLEKFESFHFWNYAEDIIKRIKYVMLSGSATQSTSWVKYPVKQITNGNSEC